ncbi:MAG: contractile injection system tape measure protein [Bacteroidota bacterium]|nr:contractile injection system tape measure protein [Bacteroidota bacterium]
MERHNHIIHKQVAEVGFNNRAGVQQLFQEMSTLFNAQLGDITNRVLDRTVPSDMFILIDQLEVDMKTLSYPFSETEFADKYEFALEKALSLRIKKINNATIETVDEKQDEIFKLSYTTLLQHFLLKGTLPWWANNETTTDPTKTFFAHLSEDSNSLKKLLLQIGSNNLVLKRLVYQFPEQAIKEVVTLVEPTQSNFIFAYHKDISILQQKKQLVKAESASFEKLLWYFILTYIFIEKESRFHRKMFVKHSFEQMAAHYNLSYEQLLFLFSQTAQKHPDMLRASDSLPSLILELREETTSPVITESFSVQEIELRNDEILLHFLFYGSLPSRCQHYSALHIESLLRDMLKQKPDRVRQLLDKQGSSQQFLKRLTHVFSEALIIELIHLTEPVQSGFITNYHASVLGLQKKKNIVKSEESEFGKSLWEFIFTFLLNDRGTMFNTKAFVESNIRQLARHYNMSFMDLLLFLTQGMGEELAIISKHSTLFYLFSEILREQHKQSNNKESFTSGKTSLIIDETIRHSTFTRDVLLFWLIHGYMPWWADNVYNTEPAQLLLRFALSKPKEALLLLQLALQKGIAKTVLLRTISQQLITILQQATDGNIAISSIKNLEQLTLPKNNLISHEDIYEILLAAVLETYNENHFETFNRSRFLFILSARLQQLSGLSSNLIATHIVSTLKNKKANFQEKDIKAFTETIANKKEIELRTNDNHFFRSFDERTILIEGQALTSFPPDEQYSSVIALVEYFLLHNRFPKHVHIEAKAQTNFLLHRMVLLIYQQDKARLKNLFDCNNFSVAAHMRIHDIFAYHNDQETQNIAFLLSAYVERDTLLYLNEKWPQVQQTSQLDDALAWIEKNANVSLRKKMYNTLMSSPSVAHLAAVKYKGEAFTRILNNIANEQERSLINDYSYVLGLAVGNSFDRENLLLFFREFCFGWFSVTSPQSHVFFFPEFLKFLSQRKNWNVSQLHTQLTSLPAKLATSKPERMQELLQQMQSNSAVFASKAAYLQTLKTHEDMERKAMHEVVRPEAVKTSNEAPSKKITKMPEGEKIYVNNAGLVLLNPFISTYFMRTGVAENGKFVNNEAQQRATHLLQYLVDNTENTAEQTMPLNKILSGISLEETIPDAVTLTNDEKKTANELLTAVIQSWDKLKNTSLQGLQVSFLQRNGTLTESDEAWTLKIEQRAYDILLQTLPWGLSFIKFSWMTKPLFVEWT